MRLWSIHPSYLDAAGLTACWREALLARKVLAGETRGYTRYPQLARFRTLENPLYYIDVYICTLYDEAARRGYRYDPAKICRTEITVRLPVSRGQMEYEFEHLKKTLTAKPFGLPAALPSPVSAAQSPVYTGRWAG